MRPETRRKLSIGFVLILLFLLANALSAWVSVQQLMKAAEWRRHTFLVQAKTDALLSSMQDVETGARGYVLTGAPDFLEPYNSGVSNAPRQIVALSNLTQSNATQQARLPLLERQVRDKLAISRGDIDLRDRAGPAAARRNIASRRGKAAMDAIRGTIAAIQTDEAGLLAQRERRVREGEQVVAITLALFTVSSVVLLTGVFLMMARAEGRREQLHTALAELKRLEEMRDSLTAMLVHDLRTPLTTLLGPLDMLASDTFGSLDAAQHEIVDMSRQGGYRLLGLVNELLDISKMEAGQMQVRHETVRMSVVVDAALREVQRLDLGEAARIERDLPPDLPLVQADEELLTRVLINLVGNALKFTPAKGTITVAARRVAPSDLSLAAMPTDPAENTPAEADPASDEMTRDVVLVSVRDTGEGIPAANLSSVFEKFGQVEGRKAGRKMSTGLGLTFCKLAVEAHGGRIWVESKLGEGSVFKFTVPLRPWADSAASREAAEAAAAVG